MNGESWDKEGPKCGGNALFCHKVYGTKGYITNLIRTHSYCKLLVYKNSFSLLVLELVFKLLVWEKRKLVQELGPMMKSEWNN
jgi:hypothetical protein